MQQNFVFSRLHRLIAMAILVSALGCASGGGGGGESDGDSSDSGSGSDIFSDFDTTADDSPVVVPNSILSNTGFARDAGACATEDPDDGSLAALSAQFTVFQATQRDAGPLSRDTTATIPVVFHVISKGPSIEEGEVPDSQLIAQVDVLNQNYSGAAGGTPTPFRFSLGSINRVRNAEWFDMVPGSQQELDMKSALHTGGPETLNIYTVNTDGKILGFASFPLFYLLIPSFDGVVINFQTVPGGSFSRYDVGRVAVHEVGHWLGLLHTFQGECGSFFGDLVADTPDEALPERGQFCPVGRDSCTNSEGMDPVHNHMTYTDDACRFEFTPGQLELMRFNSVAFRGLAV